MTKSYTDSNIRDRSTQPQQSSGTGPTKPIKPKGGSPEASNSTPPKPPDRSIPRSKSQSALHDNTTSKRRWSIKNRPTRRSSGNSADSLKQSLPSSSHQPESDVVPVPPKLLRRFYEPLVLLYVLDRNRGDRIPRHNSDTDGPRDELRRSFVDSIAYICDYKKGGDTVTAAALQREPAGVTIWLAANNHVKEETIYFLRQILNDLVVVSASTQALTEDRLAARIIDYNRKRLQAYRALIKQPLKQCLAILKSGQGCKHLLLNRKMVQFKLCSGECDC